jgi:glycosyltransferase involved in cell wall biosynthesis
VRCLNYLWHNWGWPPTESLFGAVDLTHAAHPLPLPNRRGRRCVTLHDLYFLDHPQHTSAEISRDYPRLVGRALREADAVIVPSRATRERALSRFELDPRRVRTIPLGIDPLLLTSPEPPEVEGYRARHPDLPERFLLFVGTREPRKNVGLLLRAFSELRRWHPELGLVLAGPVGWGPQLPVPPGTVLRGYVEPSELRLLYHSALAIAVPSLDEGFGLPAAEAMACGCPVLASRAGALPEVVGEAGILLDPLDLEAWTGALRELVEQPERRAQLAARGRSRAGRFRWETAAQNTLALYRELVAP